MSDFLERVSEASKQSILLKLSIIGVLALLLLIPTAMISDLIRERESTKHDAVEDICNKWGGAQTISGPVLGIPYVTVITNPRTGKSTRNSETVYLLPDQLNINGKSSTETRYRGIYKAILYNTQLDLTGQFDLNQLNTPSSVQLESLDFSKTVLFMGINDMKGIRQKVQGTFGDTNLELGSGLPTSDLFRSGLQAKTPLNSEKKVIPFKFSLNLNGSRQLDFLPMGKNTHIQLNSNWSAPSFSGEFLPVTREVSNTGFSAEWQVQDLNRSFPQAWIGSRNCITPMKFGVNFYDEVDVYQKSNRTIKYAMMFIIFTFAALFLSEVLCGFSVHPIQYLFIGGAIVMFYALLISFSEHISFDISYLVASISVLILISGYVKALFKKLQYALTISGVLIVLYSFLYLLLQMSDYALLSGTVGLFGLLAILMFVTRNINWYSVKIAPAN